MFNLKYLLKLILALILVCILWEIIITCFIFDNPDYLIYPKGIVPKEGSNSLNTQEGYARLEHKNEFGTYNIYDVDKVSFLYQGDSFTFAKQVSPEKNYINLIQKNISNFQHINAGNFGTHIADYYYNYDSFQNYSIKHYFIQVRYGDFIESFEKSNLIHFNNNEGILELEFGNNGIINFFKNNFRLYSTINKVNLINVLKEKYFNLLISKFNFNSKTIKSTNRFNVTNYLIKEQLLFLREKYQNNFTLVYIPMNPIYKDNYLDFNLSSNEKVVKSELLKYSQELNISLIDVSNDLNKEYFKNKVLPWGFDNTIPGEGHFNELGHNIMANYISNYIAEEILK